MRRFRYEYGAGPLHLLAILVCFAIVAYAVSQMLGRGLPNLMLWFVGAILLHDAILFPLYAGSDRLAGLLAKLTRQSAARPRDVSGLNYLRFVTVFSALMFIVWFPLILGLGGVAGVSGQPADGYLERWLGLSLLVALLAALVYTVRWRRRAG